MNPRRPATDGLIRARLHDRGDGRDGVVVQAHPCAPGADLRWRDALVLLRPARGRYALAFALLALTWVMGLALLAVSGWFLTATALAGAGLLATLNLYTPSGVIRGLAVGRPVARYFERLIGHDAVLRTLRDLRVRVFAGVLRQPLHRVDALHSADAQTRLSADVDTLDAIPLRVLGPAVAALATLVVVALIAGGLGGVAVAWVLTAEAALILAASAAAARRGRAAGQAVVRARARERQALLETLGGLPDAIGRGTSPALWQALAELDAERTRRRARQDAIERGATVAAQALIGLGALVVAVFAVSRWAEGTLSAPVAVALPLLALGLGEALAALPGAFWRWAEAAAAQARLAPLLEPLLTRGPGSLPGEAAVTSRALSADEVASARVGSGRRDGRSASGSPEVTALAVEALRVGFVADAPLLAPQTRRVVRGQPAVVTGPSGVGKSALLATLAGELAPLEGAVWFEPATASQALAASGYGQPWTWVSHLPQDPVLPDATIGEVLRLGFEAPRPVPDDAACWAALRQVALDADLRRAGVGLDERIGPRGRFLSGGQRQRLALAAVVLQDRPVVLLDEPFAGLNAALRERVIASLAPFWASRVVVIVSHEADALPAAWVRWPVQGA